MSLMSNPDITQLNIEISASDTAVEDIDRMTCQLFSELRELDIESAELTKGGRCACRNERRSHYCWFDRSSTIANCSSKRSGVGTGLGILADKAGL